MGFVGGIIVAHKSEFDSGGKLACPGVFPHSLCAEGRDDGRSKKKPASHFFANF